MFLRDMDLGVPVAPEDWRLWSTGCQCAAVHNWQWTPLWCAHCTRTAGPGEEQRS